MKCPKCGFTSFDYLDSCKKCGNELGAFKARHGLRSLLFAGNNRSNGQQVRSEVAETPEEALRIEATEPTDFGFDFMDEPETAAAPSPPAPKPEAKEAGEEVALPEDFSFDEAGEGFELDGGAAESELPDLESDGGELPAFEASEDFSFFDAAEEEQDLLGGDELPSWDAPEEVVPEKKPLAKKETADPFEQRESAAAGQVPETLVGQPSPPGRQEPRDPASLVGRLGALLADLLVVGSVLTGFLLVGQRLLAPNHGLFPDPEALLRLSGPYFLLVFLGCFGYFTIFHLLFGQTPGKMLFGLGVETLDGSPLSVSQAFLRSVGGLAGWCLAGLGYASILFDSAGRGWNDRLAGTRVVSWEEQEPLLLTGEDVILEEA